MRFRHLLPLLLVTCLGSSQPLMASESLLDLLTVLRDNGIITEAQYKKLIVAAEDELDADDDEAASQLMIETKGGLEVATYDGEFSYELGGRIIIDATHYKESLNDLGDGTELRRARIDMEGTLYGDWGYEFGVDFGDKDADIKDAYVSYQGFDRLLIQFGQFKQPFSLEEVTSSRYLTFMEAGLPNEFAPGRAIGIGARQYWDNWTVAGGVFGEAFDDDAKDEGDEGWSATGRVTYSPWHDDREVLHFGAAFSRQWTDDSNKVKYNARPETHLSDIKFLNTGSLNDTNSVDLLGVEAAMVSGSWSMQAEYIKANVDRDEGNSSPEFNGWYVLGSWFLTGESRHYKFKKGSFGRVKPTASNGAWELAARYSTLDLDDVDIFGGTEKNWTLGVNWYINPQIRLFANYVLVDNNINADDDEDVLGNDDLDIFQVRFQIDY